MSILSNSDKDFFESVIKDVAETFERNIIVSLEGQKATISTDLNYSRFSPQADQVENTPVYYTIPARILYQEKQAKEFTDAMQGGTKDEAQLKIDGTFGLVRIKVNESGNAILKDAKEIELDGEIFNVKTTARPHGVFSAKYFTYYLERMQ